MTKKTTRRALITSVISMLLCVTMLVGTTFAWFTDSVKSGKNKIVAGNLDIELEYLDGDKWETVNGETNVFKEGTLWEPGHTEVVYLKVKNAGTLALKYDLGVNVASEVLSVNVKGELLKLSDHIMVGVVDGRNTAFATRDEAHAAFNANDAKAINAGYAKNGSLEAKGEDYVALVVYMPETVGNEANYKTGAEIPEILLGIDLYATQLASENDSFNNRYDAGAPWTGATDISWYTENPDATEFIIDSPEGLAGLAAIVNGTATAGVTTFAAGTATAIQDTFNGKTVKLTTDVDLRNIEWTPIGRIGTTSTDFTYSFRGTFDGGDHTVSNLNVSNEGWAGVFGIAYKATINNLKVNGVKLESNRMTGAIVGQLYGSIDNCHVSNASITVTPNAVKDGFDNGDKVGGIVGWLGDNGNNHTLTNCSADKVTVKAYRDVGCIAGYVAWSTTLSGNKVTESSVLSDQSVGFYGHKDANAGKVWGRNSVSNNGEGIIDTNNTAGDDVTVEVRNVVATVDELKDALTNGGTYYVACDINLDADVTMTVPAGVTAVLDLNGHTIAGITDDADKNDDGKLTSADNEVMIDVRGTLTVKNGTMTIKHTSDNFAWNACTEIFYVGFNGTLNVKDMTLENIGGSDMAYAIDLVNATNTTLKIENSTVKSSYIAVRVFNNSSGMNNVTIEDSTLDGKYAFWVHIYSNKDNGGKGIKSATLNFDIYNGTNTFKSTAKPATPIIYGFDDEIYLNSDGLQVVTAPIDVAVAPLEEDFLFPAGTAAVIYKDMVLSGDAQIVHEENAVLGLQNVKADLDHDVIIRKSGGAICISDCDFTLADGAKLISVGEGGDAHQVFLINVTVNGELLTDTNAGQYLEGISWFGAYPEWPNT
ncbi:MAG: hypothetical protein IJZ03_05750 [Clostridia bacterium]|nr:hypothetical protein [Clostridia bacterium]